MFDDGDVSVREWQRRLSAALTSPSGLDDAGRIDRIRELEELVCTATAAQAMLAAELDASVREERRLAGERVEQRGRGVAAQVALARRESPHRGQRHLGLARVVADELPHTWQAWRSGRITEWTAMLVARETACLSLEHRRAVDAEVAGDPAKLERMGVRQVGAACRSVAARLDPASVVERRRRAEADRRVTLRPAPDTMTWLTALLPVKEGVAAYAALLGAAADARATGDPRTSGQVMADTLVASVLTGPGEASAPRVELGLVMTDAALFGDSDEPAHLTDYGPIPAEFAREMVAGACSRGEDLWLRRLYSSPTTGELVTMDSRTRRFPSLLGRFIRLRDQFCRTPWCGAPVRHTDHVTSVADDGETSGANGQGHCEACNYAKQAAGWRASPVPDADGHEVMTTTPTGHTYRSHAPPVARIHSVPPVTIDYVLAG